MTKKILPSHWCNFLCDYPELYQMTTFHPDKKEQQASTLLRSLPRQPLSLLRQSHDLCNDNIQIPEEIQAVYQTYRPTPFKRAIQLERALQTTANIYYKFEGANIAGSHKLNTAIAQAYYYLQAGIKHVVTGTGAGQWGTAMAYACNLFGLECTIFMVSVSLQQKPMRQSLMSVYGATVYESPSDVTNLGRRVRDENPYSLGSLAIATGEAIEWASQISDAQFAVGSGENSVLLHQTIIGNEVLNQLDSLQCFPDHVYACVGAGSNFCGISMPLMRYAKQHQKQCEFVAVEPLECPKLTQGHFVIEKNDFSDDPRYSKMYTLGSSFVAPPIHAGGLRYHGTSEMLSALYDKKYVTARAISEQDSLDSGLLFSKKEGILPAPESAYALAAMIDDVRQGKMEGKNLLVNISGHGLYDLTAYETRT